MERTVKSHTVSGVYLRNGMQTPRSMSSCSSAGLDLLNCNDLPLVSAVDAEVLLETATLPLEPAAAAKVENRVRHSFLTLLPLNDSNEEEEEEDGESGSKVRGDRFLW